MKIVIDGFGGDNSPDEVLKGAALAVKELGIDIAITGDEKVLMERMKELNISDSHIELVPAQGVITTEDAPKSVIKENAGTSMGKALYYLADGNADAFISAGSTAAIVVGGTMVEKRIKGVKRTALVPLMPCLGGGGTQSLTAAQISSAVRKCCSSSRYSAAFSWKRQWALRSPA